MSDLPVPSSTVERLSQRLRRLLELTPEARAGVADVSQAMKLLACGECGVVHAVPAELFVAVVGRGGRVFCPNGHATTPAVDPQERRGLLAMLVWALAELRQRTADLKRLTTGRESASAETPADTPTMDLDARLKAIVRRAARPDRGWPMCPFCRKSYRGNERFRRHLKYAHVEQINALPLSHFD